MSEEKKKKKAMNRLKSMYALRANIDANYARSVEAVKAGKPTAWSMVNWWESDPILKAMHRRYTASDYIDLTRRLRAAIPKMTFTTDVIVGFPGETEADFQATLALIREIPVDLAYCFKYSPRPGTAAAQLPEQIPQEVKEERLSRLLDTIRQLALASHAALVGETEQVLVEVPDPKRAGRLRGRSRTNRWIQFDGPVEWIGREVTVRITAAEAWTLHGECEPIS